MAKTTPPTSYKLRRSAKGRVDSPRPVSTNPKHSPAWQTAKRFALVFAIGFVVAVIPDILELRRLIGQEVVDQALPLPLAGNLTQEEWYAVSLEKLTPRLQDQFVQLGEDDETRAFLVNSTKKSKMFYREMTHNFLQAFLGLFLSKTSINGLLGRSRMFVFSDEQLGVLLVKADSSWRSGFLFDIGAGDGAITSVASRHFDQTWVTEMSTPMTWLLKRRGFGIAGVDTWHTDHKLYDLVLCLNILDRCSRPVTMLENVRKVLHPGASVLVALVLPLDQYAEYGKSDHRPDEVLPVKGATFELQVNSIVRDVFEPLSYHVIRWSKLPYLSEGTLKRTYHQLSDAVFLLKLR